jgi:hypothetical protein
MVPSCSLRLLIRASGWDKKKDYQFGEYISVAFYFVYATTGVEVETGEHFFLLLHGVLLTAEVP